jgi:hypothetical protein
MADDFSKLFEGVISASKQMNQAWPYSETNTAPKDERNELVCLALYDAGWKQDGFDYVPESTDIVTHWKKEGESERKQVYLTFKQQRRWIREIERRKGIKR